MALSFRSLCVLATCALMSSACVIRFGPIDDDSTWEDTVAVDAGSGSGEAGSGSEGGAGGAGGSGDIGGAGGGDDSTSSSSSGGGDDPYCIDEVGIGQTADICDTFAVAPATSGKCDYQDPLGYRTCQRAFELFEPGHAENLASCISDIQAYEACSVIPVDNCMYEMYSDACENSLSRAPSKWKSRPQASARRR